MNTKNNKRRQATQERIEKEFIQLLQTREITQITVSEICKACSINRSTFYANFLDVYDLADKIRDKLEAEVNQLYDSDIPNNVGMDYLKLFHHVRDNQLFYNTYFKLGYDSKHTVDLGRLTKINPGFPAENMQYHVEFHRAGLNAILKLWLASGCRESPETLAKIIQDEYTNRR